MDVKDATRAAKEYWEHVYSDEETKDVGLEEVQFDESHNTWKITFGFSWPWDLRNDRVLPGKSLPRHSYKVICIDDETSQVAKSLTDRFIGACVQRSCQAP